MPFDLGPLPTAELQSLNGPREHLMFLANFLDTLPAKQFDLADWTREAECGTVACIDGWACVLFQGKSWDETNIREDAERRALLGLRDIHQAHQLFIPGQLLAGIGRLAGSISPSEAARVLRHLAATGEVDWSILA
jgi:hypothetical protein